MTAKLHRPRSTDILAATLSGRLAPSVRDTASCASLSNLHCRVVLVVVLLYLAATLHFADSH
jgi:hypothetical protein